MAENECGSCGPGKGVLMLMAPVSGLPNALTPARRPRLDQPFVTGSINTPAGEVPVVPAALTGADTWGAFKARWGVGRMTYTVDPGLYALGSPGADSPVLVTANYKMSFDRLREALPGRSAWILVLDTKGINVWCAAGKGTFGTMELVGRIAASSLAKVVGHRELVVPQLGAPGVSAHTVKKLSGFRVRFGPVRAVDLPAYLDAGMKAAPEMRRMDFTLRDRFVLIPIELVTALKVAVLIMAGMFFLSGFFGSEGFTANLLREGTFSAVAVLGAVFAGTVLGPVLLPFLPGRAFSAKGFTAGALTALALVAARGYDPGTAYGLLKAGGWVLMISSMAAFLVMNFTGSSTFTSLSGVRREMRRYVPLEIGGGVAGLVLWLAARFFT
jgi:hypothetical protein